MKGNARLAAASTAVVLCVSATAGGAWLGRPDPVDYGSVIEPARGIYAVTDRNRAPDRWYVTDSDGNVTRVPGNAAELPWSVSVTYSLDGPDVTAKQIRNASGLVGIHITVKPAGGDAGAGHPADTVPVVAFTIPSHVADDVTADAGVSVTTVGDNTLVAVAGDPDSGLDLHCYANAKRFSISAIAVAVIPSSTRGSSAGGHDDDHNGETDLSWLSSSAGGLVDSLTDAGSGEHDALIKELKALRDNERSLGKTTIAQREPRHTEAFNAYMKAYVSSYTSHLSGSIGSTTQLTALIGTAGELGGDTPLAQAVMDLAQATNNLSAAYRHVGAADAIDDLIQRIERQGTTGLTEELNRLVSEDSSKGSKQWTAGQNQLSSAMIPYSMAYTDAYTMSLSTLTGGGSNGATGYIDQAIANMSDSDALTADHAKVDAAMDALADAAKLTGASQALQQIVTRYSAQFEASGSGTSSTGTADGNAGGSADGIAGGSATAGNMLGLRGLIDVRRDSLMGTTQAIQAKHQQDERRKQTEAARQKARQEEQSGHLDSLVDDTIEMSESDVMSFAGGVTSSLGGGSKADTKTDGQDGKNQTEQSASGDAKASQDTSDGGKSDAAESDGDGSSASDSAARSSSADSAADVSSSAVPSSDVMAMTLYGFDALDAALSSAMSAIITETVEIGEAGDILQQAATALGGNESVLGRSDQTAYLMAVRAI